MRLFTQHVALAMLARRYGPSGQALHANAPASPFQNYLDAHYSPLPASVINAADYRDLIAVMREHGSNAIAEVLTDPDRTPGRE
jgi:hypothetical protein